MRTHRLAALMLGLAIAALGVGCNSKGSSSGTDLTSPTSSAPGTPVKQPLGASSVGDAGTKPAPAH